jgi:hypothetical protein
MLGFLPPIVIAAKARTRSSAQWAIGFTVAYLVGFVLVALSPERSASSEDVGLLATLGTSIFMVAAVGGTCYGVVVGRALDWGVDVPAPAAPAAVPDINTAAIAGLERARRKRAEARALAMRDPLAARDLRIGRPDLPRHYDDGGLIDVNNAPPKTLVDGLGISVAHATRIVDARLALGGFRHPDDLVTFGGLTQQEYDALGDRIILL